MMLYFAHSAVRVAVYRIIELWVRVGGVSLLQGSPSHTELLFTHLMGDITPGSEAVKVRLRVFVSNTIRNVISNNQGPLTNRTITNENDKDTVLIEEGCIKFIK